MACVCGFSTIYPECNGTHKVVKKVREQVAKDIEALKIIGSVDNAVGMQILAAKIARGQK